MTDETGMMILPVTHREILIRQSEVPGAPFEWPHDETDAHRMAASLDDAIRQINLHIGSPDPDCRICQGHGSEDWAFLAVTPCRLCAPAEVAA